METLHKSNSTKAISPFDVIHTTKTLYLCLPMGMNGLKEKETMDCFIFPFIFFFFAMIFSISGWSIQKSAPEKCSLLGL